MSQRPRYKLFLVIAWMRIARLIPMAWMRIAPMIVVAMLATPCAWSQTLSIPALENPVLAGSFAAADQLMNHQVDSLLAAGQFDTVANYVHYVGAIALELHGEPASITRVKQFIERVRAAGARSRAVRQLFLNASEYYGSIGSNALGYSSNLEALKVTEAMPGHTMGEIGKIHNNLATFASRMGDGDLSKQHARMALQYLESVGNTDFESLYVCYNGIATNLWYASKIDSAIDYYGRALKALARSEQNPLNKYYRVSIVENNLSAIYGMQGRVTEAIAAMRKCIAQLDAFQNSGYQHPRQKEAITFKLEATDNLAGIYKDLGDYAKAQELMLHSYEEKKKKLTPGNPAGFVSQILLGQLYFAMKQQEKCEQYLLAGLAGIAHSDGDYLFWQADGNYTLALLYDERGDKQKAAVYFSKADALYSESLQGDYDNVYLEFLQNEALFFSENGEVARGMALAKKGYDYIVRTEGRESLMGYSHLLNLSEVSYNGGVYREARNYSIQGNAVLDQVMHSSHVLLDSIRMESRKPKAILLQAKADYALMARKDVPGLSALLSRLKAALALLERRKAVIQDPADIGVMMSDQSELLEFVKKITLELFRITGDPAYGQSLIEIHESAMYNRIRSRLDMNDSLRYSNVPAAILNQERKLRTAITTALGHERSDHADRMTTYFAAIEAMNQFQARLRKDYPQYYQMRYGTIFQSLDSTFASLPPGASVIRYFFVDKELFAMVGDRAGKQLVPLDAANITPLIASVSTGNLDAGHTGQVLYQLYNQLWAPLAPLLHHNKLVIIPDGVLYNLNFELLTPRPIHAFDQLATGSLIATYTISYDFSLFLLKRPAPTEPLHGNFVGFAPGFSDDIKQQYRASSRDSQQLDNGYLSLLPQPFTVGLANSTYAMLGGTLFLNDRSTAASFRQHAGENRIIHIGTHAEANNQHPEYSRLIFAKGSDDSTTDNSVYLYELYNCDLHSDLTVLTACESGRPGFQDGEGMISMAHAFYYAGSRSMLTGLWKIDEQASAMLMKTFYALIKEGMDKDEALRQAKLKYLSQARGRMLAPVYWAGLVLMGDTAPIDLPLQPWWKTAFFQALAAITILLIGLILLFRKRVARWYPKGKPGVE